jgi:hypothetical protein
LRAQLAQVALLIAYQQEELGRAHEQSHPLSTGEKFMKAIRFAASALALAACTFFNTASFAQRGLDPTTPAPGAVGMQPYPQLANWAVDSTGFNAQLVSSSGATAKAATDRAAVFRPVAPCRLFDTRGFAAAISIPGPFAAGSTTNINAAGFCGIPNNSFVSGLSVAITVQNLTPFAGGYIATQQQGAPISAINTVFNTGAEWIGTTANIPIPNNSGNFSVYIANSTVHVVVDVNGYYQDMNELDVGAQELDVVGNTVGTVFEVSNVGTGIALAAGGYGTGGTALTVWAGSVRASGAGVGSNTFATIHQVNTAGVFGGSGTLCELAFTGYSVIDNVQANGDPNAILLITPRRNNSTGTHADYAVEAFYYPSGSCTPATTAHWMIHRVDGAAHVNNAQFNILIIKP